MSRIDKTFANLGKLPGLINPDIKGSAEYISLIKNDKLNKHRSALVCFVPAGYPDIETSRAIINNLPQMGADIVEIGIPFSDASADGSEIRQASRCALMKGINLATILDMAQDFRTINTDTPLILMGYYNPIFSFGLANFVKAAKGAEIDGLIIVDLPPEEEKELVVYLDNDKDFTHRSDEQDLDLIRLITPTTDSQRLQTITAKARGFLYYVSVTGVTGSNSPDWQKVKEHIKELGKEMKKTLPLAVGFGIKNEYQVKQFAQMGQAVVVGSALVKTIRESVEVGDNLVATQAKLASQIGKYVQSLANPP